MENPRGKKAFNPVPLVIVLSALLTASLFIFWLYSMISFHVHTNLSQETKADMERLARCPGISGYIERYGDRGPMDIDYQIETCTFPSLAALSGSINICQEATAIEAAIDEALARSSSGQSSSTTGASLIERTISKVSPRKGRDLKGKTATIYEIDHYCPASEPNYRPGDSYKQEDYWSWTYSVYEYKDGTYRFVVNVQTS